MKYLALSIITLFTPLGALAHTKWFAETDLPPLKTDEPTLLYLSIWAGICAAIVACGIWFEKKGWFCLSFLAPKSDKPHIFARAASTFVMATGAFFIIAGTHEYIFSPNLTIDSGIPAAIIYAQIFIGLALLLGIASRTAGIALALLWASLFPYVGWIEMIEDIWVLSTALFILFMGNDYFSIISFSALRSVVAPFKRYALSILRIGTGLTLMILGLSEKILAPEYGINFLAHYNWNFMELLGYPYSDYLFTLSAGSVELLFGLIFVLGVVTRFNALVVATVFSIPLFILGPIELAGHLPHFMAILLLLLFGNGGYFTLIPHKKHPS